ncbi:hypothetical protein FG386_001942 [Cryptosporidium ryanae]|uniref:uncharacterized protein n=1 Tax=Cryptosporidium ryanae TaxID=515981 RepID=UPI00351A7EBE|nr:hypothetical protein FG386_001942 [Cryptosporidium ryanae]
MKLIQILILLAFCLNFVFSEDPYNSIGPGTEPKILGSFAPQINESQQNITSEDASNDSNLNEILPESTDSELITGAILQNLTFETPDLMESVSANINETSPISTYERDELNNETQIQPTQEKSEGIVDFGTPVTQDIVPELMLVQQEETAENQNLEEKIVVKSEEKEDNPDKQENIGESPRKSRIFVNRKLSTPEVQMPINLLDSSNQIQQEQNGSLPADNSQQTPNYLPIVIRRILPAFAPDGYKENVSTGALVENSAETSNILKNSIGNLSGFSNTSRAKAVQ